MEKDILKIDDKNHEFFVLFRYEGIKEEVNLKDNYLLLWYDYEDSKELWFLIKANKEYLWKYLSNKLTLLNLMLSSIVYLYERHYDDYDNLKNGKDITNVLDQFELPDEDAYIERDFSEILKGNIGGEIATSESITIKSFFNYGLFEKNFLTVHMEFPSSSDSKLLPVMIQDNTPQSLYYLHNNYNEGEQTENDRINLSELERVAA